MQQVVFSDRAGPFGPTERPMAAYVSLPSDWTKPSKRSTEWVDRSAVYVAAQLPKARK